MGFGTLQSFAAVFTSEVASINKRRPAGHQIELEQEPFETSEEIKPLRPTEQSQVVGLALSGGGVRSSAFCLGALQGLREANVLSKVDYLSTVSGGGYIGASLSVGMTATGGRFPFKADLSEDETPSVQHIRDYSNYLFPDGAFDLLRNLSIVARGLVANAIVVLPVLLFAAFVTIKAVPFVSQAHKANIFGFEIPNIFPFEHFVITSYLVTVLGVLLIGWGIVKSFSRRDNEASGWRSKAVGILLSVVLFTAFCEFQPYILRSMLGAGPSTFWQDLVAWIQSVILWLTPVAAAVALFAQKLGELVKTASEANKSSGFRKAIAAKLLVYAASAVVPLLIWTLYLYLSYWGICVDRECIYSLAPDWLVSAAHFVPISISRSIFGGDTHLVAQLYVMVLLLCLIVVCFLRPNANSLHPLYRDRLSKAFLFQPQKYGRRDPKTGRPLPLLPLSMNLSGLSEKDCPYHLINAALNIQGSRYVNQRGRNADFFIFSRNFVGSRATGYVATTDMESVMPGLDVGTAMAASGAAASANMGGATIKPLTPTLALLNVRLGYWLRNPAKVFKGCAWDLAANYYFLLEMLGLLNENRQSVYVTDGGHIENLGIYELLRRRCRVIVVVDAEADPEMAFSSFNVLVRHAVIDLGIRIELPWQQIADRTKEAGKAIDDEGDTDKAPGPHVAVGQICYPGGRTGVLVYIKSSLTGDENDYIFHYKKRYEAFPHETTIDQLFSEEQFEAYRALGFHATNRFFSRRDKFACPNLAENPCIREEVKLLDQLFPRVGEPDPCRPQDHTTFEGWLPSPQGGSALESGASG
ncbi:MAG TPA: patatin-like phospholipase family protein [Pseudolabrys sp.]|nr:patatin-like phospholipase family protein [Pseudolabrys sp.]